MRSLHSSVRRRQSALFFSEELAAVSSEMHYATDDGSYGHHGFVTDVLRKYLESGRTVDKAIAVGPVPMMKAVCEITKQFDIPTTASLNAIMVDGTRDVRWLSGHGSW